MVKNLEVNVKYCKFINDKKIEPLTKKYIVIDGMVYANPTPSRLKGAGYLPLFSEKTPEYDEKSETLERIYTPTDEGVIESFVIRKKEKENEIYTV
ncbi:MAG: hypothetical protein IIW20_00635 [Clostridia bacterium]|jgi:hypothetical protein|nr:hypothetical protein [Clostridia bacterium]